MTTSSLVVLLQELKLDELGMADFAAWAAKRQWQVIYSAAAPGPAGSEHHLSAGVAIACRQGLGLRHPGPLPSSTSHVISPGRLVAGYVDYPGGLSVLVGSCYLHDGQGLSRANRGILLKWATLTVATTEAAPCWLLGGDFNIQPEILVQDGLPERLAGKLVAMSGNAGTCVMAKATKHSNIDFFIVDGRMAKGCKSVSVCSGWMPRPHRPVELTFYAGLARLKVLEFLRPKALPAAVPFGPINRCPTAWAPALAASQAAVEAAINDEPAQALGALDAAYSIVMKQAELDLFYATDTCRKGLGKP